MSEIVPEKLCPRCKNVYPATFEYWHKDKSRKDGLFSWCKVCSRNNVKKWAKANPDKRKKQVSIYKRKHRESLRVRKLHYRHNNRDKVRQTELNWRKRNPEKVRKISRDRRIREINAKGSHSADDTKRLFEEQKGLCFHCNKDISDYYEEDHWIPLSRGGTDYIGNIRLLCFDCNRAKSNKFPHEWDSKYQDTT